MITIRGKFEGSARSIGMGDFILIRPYSLIEDGRYIPISAAVIASKIQTGKKVVLTIKEDEHEDL